MNNNCFNEQIYYNENVHFSRKFVFIRKIKKLYLYSTKDKCMLTVLKYDKLQGKTLNLSDILT